MAAKTWNPAQRADAGRARNIDHAGVLIGSENNQNLSEIQRLRRAFIARRVHLSPSVAELIAASAFGTSEAAR